MVSSTLQVRLAATNLSVAFDGQTALTNVSLTVGGGESVAIVGSSGSGKSTLLHCLAGLRVPDTGDVVIDGSSLRGLDEKQRSALRLRTLGIVFQFAELVPELTIAENVALPAWLGDKSRAEADDLAAELLTAFGIEASATKHPGQVSGGERQRAAVARALVHEPSVLFADEPTGSLDSTNADRVVDALLDAARQRGTAVVMVTHEARLAERLGRKVTMRDGCIVDERQR
jgi:putative ABC transport system ATP-binding protein